MATTTTSNDLPDLSTVTNTATQSTTTSSTSSTSSTTTSSSITSTIASFSSGTTTNSGLSGLPTIAGAGIPTMVVPYTANAPFMQKSDYPEGTVFIAVGAVLAFFGACILLWRGLVAWSITRSVKRSAMASIRSSEKHQSTWGPSGYAPVKDSFYKEPGSSMSMDALNHAGKPLKGQYKDNEIQRSATPPAGLFFSPTAQANQGTIPQTRGSSYLPAGYYASPSAQAAGGAGVATVGGSRAPYARHSRMEPSPPGSRGSTYRATSRDGLRAPSRDGYSSARNSHLDPSSRIGHTGGPMYSSQSDSSIMVGGAPRHPVNDSPGNSRAPSLAGSRAPSAYLDDLFENHGHGPRERF